MKVAVVGSTGMVGQVMLKVLADHNFPVTELIPVASERSIGKLVKFKDGEYPVVSIQTAIDMKPELAIFSAGGSTSKAWAPKFAEAGTTVVDNSSAWRMDPAIKLVVPEINGESLDKNDKIIANPNCSTIQLVVALNLLHKEYELDRLVVSTYQSVTGTGVAAVRQMDDERARGQSDDMVYPHPIDKNCLPHGGDFLDNGYTTEEMKLVNETRKIFGDASIRVTATVVRVPVVGGHSESVNVSFKKPVTLEEVKSVLEKTPGVIIQDDPAKNEYPMPLYSEGRDDVFVGRIRLDESNSNSYNMWVVSDNLRKGAATNAVQIATFLNEKGLLKHK